MWIEVGGRLGAKSDQGMLWLVGPSSFDCILKTVNQDFGKPSIDHDDLIPEHFSQKTVVGNAG